MNIKCPIMNCGHENPPEATHCASCGAKVQAYHRLLLFSDYLFNEGLTLAQSGHFDHAEQHLRAATLLRSNDAETWLLLAEVQILQGHLKAAAQTLTYAANKCANQEALLVSISRLQALLEQHVTAAQAPPATKAAAAKPPPRPGAAKPPKPSKSRRKRKRKH